MKAKKLTEQGYRIFIAGEHTHGEIQGIQGYSPTSIILGSAQEAESIAAELASTMEGVPTALIGQTTISTEEFQAVELALKQFFPEILIMDSICSATKERQKALRELCGQVEALIVVGGKESANTRRLYNIAVAHNKPAWLVENADDIPEAVRCYCVVGLTAGASTPDSVIDEIQANLENG
jgi:4-hydroxy-3-methylbut-2-enyl diphosphate reductase